MSRLTTNPVETGVTVILSAATPAPVFPPTATSGPFDALFQFAPRTIDAVEVQDDAVYLNVDPILVILDVTERKAPRLLGTVKLPVEGIISIVASGHYAYVAAGESGLRIVDVSKPAHPREVGAYHPPQGARAGVIDQAANQVYAYGAGTGLRVVNVTEPTRPVETAVFTPAETGVEDVTIAHEQAYITTSGGVQIADISDPTRPQAKTVLLLDWGKDITVAGDTLYVAVEICPGQCRPGESRDGSLHLFDLTEPVAPAR